jgi:glycosyltransferase involved in cell wall biosynthesis
MKPLINIITRTSRRPNGFRKTKESIISQTYDNINHVVITDDMSSKVYLEKYDIKYFYINKTEILSSVNRTGVPAGLNTPGLFPHNLYLNTANQFINEGWIMYLDDDDHLAGPTVIEKFVNHIHSNDVLFYWKIQFPDGRVFPHSTCFNNEPMPCRIGGSCLCVHSKWKDYIKWDAWQMSDYRVIRALHDTIPHKQWLDMIVINTGNNGGRGKRVDIDS